MVLGFIAAGFKVALVGVFACGLFRVLVVGFC